jgi:hypothetical protein
LIDAASNEGENHADDEDVTREKTPDFPVVCRHWFDNTLLVVDVSSLHQIRTFGDNIIFYNFIIYNFVFNGKNTLC